MKVLFSAVVSSLVFAIGCGSGTSASGVPTTPTPTGFCGQFKVGPGIICDSTTSPPTLKVDIGTGPNQVASGARGRYLGSYTPSIAQANPPTIAQPGGLVSGHGGGILYNAQTGRIGVQAAGEICAAIVWPGQTSGIATAHACTNEEILSNAYNGTIPQGTTGWSFGHTTASYANTNTTKEPNAVDSYKASCGGWTYDSADEYQGTVWTVENNDSKLVTSVGQHATAVNWISGQSCGGGVAGAAIHSIACCQ